MANIATSGFTGADGTVVSTADANWVKITGFTGTAQLFGNRLRGGSTTDSCAYRYNVAPPSADYEVACDFQVVGITSTAVNAGVMARASSSASTGYMARWRNGTGFQLFKFVGSVTAVQIGSTVAQSYTAGTTARIRLKVEGSTISVFRGSETTPIISVTDTSITAAGFAGVWTNVNSNTDGPHLDNWTADTLEVVPDVTGSVAGLATMAWSATASVSADVLEYVPQCVIPFTTNGTTPAASLTGIRWAWWDAAPPNLAIAPVDSGTGATTDASGVFSVELPNTTLASGDTGTLLAIINDGTAGSAANMAFCAPVEVT